MGTEPVAESESRRGAGAGREPAPEPPAHGPELPGSEPKPGRRVLCRMCGQPLRDRASRIWGLGPDCRHKLALRTAPAPQRDEVPQDPLPGM